MSKRLNKDFSPLKLKIHRETSSYINAKEILEEQKDSIEPLRPLVFSHLGTRSTQVLEFDRLRIQLP